MGNIIAILFNVPHGCVEYSFGLLKRKWKILLKRQCELGKCT